MFILYDWLYEYLKMMWNSPELYLELILVWTWDTFWNSEIIIQIYFIILVKFYFQFFTQCDLIYCSLSILEFHLSHIICHVVNFLMLGKICLYWCKFETFTFIHNNNVFNTLRRLGSHFASVKSIYSSFYLGSFATTTGNFCTVDRH